MLRSLLAYARGAGVDAKWAVISGNPEFFEVTKRIHNHLHNFAGDGGALGDEERVKYEAALRPNAEEFEAIVGPRHVILLHDPQTAGLIPGLKRVGLPVRPYVAQADADVFSRRSFVSWSWSRTEPRPSRAPGRLIPDVVCFLHVDTAGGAVVRSDTAAA